ncbi:MAG: DUF3343 domain-containing protein [Treponema sp.]|nr:DUF3343 domain-containing protein [Treponema sp.]
MAEQALLEGGFSVRVMPVPSSIKEGCGFCLRFLPEDLERAAVFLSERGLTVGEAYVPEETPVSDGQVMNYKEYIWKKNAKN